MVDLGARHPFCHKTDGVSPTITKNDISHNIDDALAVAGMKRHGGRNEMSRTGNNNYATQKDSGDFL
jgi:hypothetical protein